MRENRRMDQAEALNASERERIEKAAELEGITIAEAMDKQRGFRYLYWYFVLAMVITCFYSKHHL